MKHLLHGLGGLSCVIGVLFVVLRLKSYFNQIDFSNFNITFWLLIGLFVLIYGTANILLARAWLNLLRFYKVETDWLWAIRIYGLSQLAKYVPGNIFHLAGRQAMGMADGLDVKPLAMSAVWELFLISVAGTLFCVPVASLIWPVISLWIFLVMFFVISMMLWLSLNLIVSPSIGAALLCQLAFLAISGGVFIGVLDAVKPIVSSAQNLPAFCAAYVIAWLAGFLTPGAPAGVGIREMVLLFLLGEYVGQADLLLAVVVGRGVTVLGDLLYFLVSILLKRKHIR